MDRFARLAGRLGGLGSLFWIALVFVVPGGIQQSARAAGTSPVLRSSALQQFPLWSQLPTHKFVILEEGSLNQRRWGAYAFRRKGGGSSICVEIVTLRRVGHALSASSGGEECANLRPARAKLVLTESNLNGVNTTLFGTVVISDAASLELKFNPGPDTRKELQHFNEHQQSKLSVPALGYAGFRVKGNPCLEDITGRAADESTLFVTPARDCSAE